MTGIRDWAEPPPQTADSLFTTWWAATRDRVLLVQHCTECGHFQHYPRALCASCGGSDAEFVPASGGGHLYSFTEIHRAPRPGLAVPYTVCLVTLDEGPTLVSRLVNIEWAPACGARVALAWHRLEDGRNLPVFELTQAEPGNSAAAAR